MIALADSADMVWRCWQGEVVVYHLRNGAVHHLEGVAAAVFTELADGGPRASTALEAWLAQAADMPVAEVQAPLAASMESLSRCQLIVDHPQA